MKKSLLILLLIPLLSGCTANIVGKFDNYNEIFSGTTDIDVMTGEGTVYVKSTPSNITCEGDRWITYIPMSSYLLGTCKGQKGKIELSCNDGRTIQGDFVCESCTSVRGKGNTNLNEGITFYATMSKKKYDKKVDEYKNSMEKGPDIKGNSFSDGSTLEDLF